MLARRRGACAPSLEGLGEGGVEATLSYYAEDCVSEDLPNLPDRAIYRGREGVLERNRNWLEMWPDWGLEPAEFIDAGDDVVVVVTAAGGHGRESEVPIEGGITFVYEVRDGLAVRDRAFASRAEALAAAIDDAFEEAEASFEEIRDLGDVVLGLGHLRARSNQGVPMDLEYGVLIRYRDGLAVWGREWYTHAEALEAAGLSG